MHAQPRRALQRAAAALVGVFLIVWGPGAASPASAFCDSSLCSSPDALAVVAESNAMSGLAGGSVATASAGAATAGTAAGVGGVTFPQAAGGLVGVLGTVAAAIGIKAWPAGSVKVAPGGATGLTGANGNADVGWVPSNTVTSTTSSNVSINWTVSVGNVPAYNTTTNTTAQITGALASPNTAGSQYAMDVVCKASATSNSPSTGTAYSISGYLGVSYPVTMPVQCGSAGFYGLRLKGMTAGGAATGSTVWYYPTGNPQRPPQPTTGDGTITRTLQCTDGTTTSTQTQTIPVNVANGGTYNYPELDCPAGMVTEGFKADLTPSTGGSTQSVIPLTPTSPDVQAIPANYPNCLTSACALRLFKINPAPSTDCGDGAAACPDWYTDPGRASNYECHWGPYTVPLSKCSIYRVPGQVTPNAYVDGSGTTTVVDWPPLPGASTTPAPTPTSGECWPSGYSAFNPLQWVLMPVRCALVWAFVPSAATSTSWQSFVTDASARPPVNVAVGGVAFTTGVVNSLGNGTGDCSSLPLQMAGGPMGPAASFDLCAAVQQAGSTTWGQRLRDVLTVVFIGGGCWIAYHRVAKSFGGKG